MKEPEIVVEPNPPREWVETVERGLHHYNIATIGLDEYRRVGVVSRDEHSAVIGGVLGNVVGGWLHVWSLWVDRRARGRGLASDLMTAAENYALSRQCVGAFLTTASYEARPLYEKRGYRIFAELPEHPVKGHSRYWLAKDLRSAPSVTERRASRETIAMEPYVSADTEATIRRGIQTHAAGAIGRPEQSWSLANVFVRNDDGEIVGGAMGNLWGDWLFIGILWVDQPLRGNGQATRLMNAIERLAGEAGCRSAYLDTFNRRALSLYERLGYETFGVLENHPLGHAHHFLKKRLD
ncbi:MAG TPA: GNAT family N-acetyltransferase [Candidatus Binataceae bacterium]|nr:GNAT family N-acetyltransferase [Candidatus Binataceae bacterium]